MRPACHVISGLRTGGAETMLVALCGGLLARGMPQHVVSLTGDGPNAAALERLGVTVHRLAPRGAAGSAVALLRLARLIRSLRPAVVQGWLYHGDLFAAGAHRLAGAPRDALLAWGLRNSDIDHARYGRLLAIGRRLSGWPGLVVSNSRAGVDFHLAEGYRPRRLAVIPNGIDTVRFRPDPAARAALRRELGLSDEAVVAIHAARLDPMKDHATLLAAAACRPEVHFLLAGEGTLGLDLPANARALGRRDDLWRIQAAGDIAVSSSAFGEGFSNAVAEGMAAGLVPVATSVGDAGAILGGLGCLVPPRDPAALAEALRAMATLPAPARRAAGLAARARIETAYGVGAMAERFLAAWIAAGAVIGGGGPRTGGGE
ncbi:glycosyltransferase [Methylobacterium sp. Leaf112]|uniref:glycosyltransferase n=1 Tax=Methylobacterium sp. Leaf112 TaxID=1736258 RepID=UPI0012E800FF|nr:glycosyltransferase [Methylobacterium sp. Leaf112]